MVGGFGKQAYGENLEKITEKKQIRLISHFVGNFMYPEAVNYLMRKKLAYTQCQHV